MFDELSEYFLGLNISFLGLVDLDIVTNIVKKRVTHQQEISIYTNARCTLYLGIDDCLNSPKHLFLF